MEQPQHQHQHQHQRSGSLGLGASCPTDEIVVALCNYDGGGGSGGRASAPPPREELVRALTAAAEGIGKKAEEAGAIPMDVEEGGEDELDRPSSAR